MRLMLVIVLLLAGCSHVSMDAASHTGSATTVTGGQVGLHVESRSLAALVIAGMFIAAALEDVREPRPFPSFSALSDWFRGTVPLELDPERAVREQDCTRPIELGGNLKCR